MIKHCFDLFIYLFIYLFSRERLNLRKQRQFEDESRGMFVCPAQSIGVVKWKKDRRFPSGRVIIHSFTIETAR